MRKEFIKVLFLIFVFFVFYFFLGYSNYGFYGKTNSSQDFKFHYETAKNISIKNGFETGYPPFYHLLFSFFAFNEFIFYFINLILISIIIPLMVFYISKKAYAVLIYFCGTSLMHNLIFGSTFPEALILVFVLIYFANRKNLLLWIILTFLAFLTHKSGGYLFLLIGFAELISLMIVVITNRFNEKINNCLPAGYLIGTRLDSLQSLSVVLLSILPIPILYFGIKKIISNAFYTIIFIGSLIIAIQLDIRALSIIQLIFCFTVAEEIETKNKRIQIGLMLFLAAQTTFYLIDFGFTTWKLIVF